MKSVWLRCEVIDEINDEISKIKLELFDGTPTEITVRNVLLGGLDSQGRFGWVKVEPHGETKEKVAVSLPTPSLQFGREITVKPGYVKVELDAPPPPKNKQIMPSVAEQGLPAITEPSAPASLDSPQVSPL